MANIHGFNNFRDNQRNQGGYGYGPQRDEDQEQQLRDFAEVQDQLPLLGSSNAEYRNPRDEDFWYMLKMACCPSFKWSSFIIYVTILDVIVYLITLITGCCSGGFLGPTAATLRAWGSLYPYGMRYQGQIYRFITPVFLHANFLHILLNVAGQLIIGFQLEKISGPINAMAIYFISAQVKLILRLGGILMSALASDQQSVGSSTAIFGLLGAIFAYYIMNWKTLDIVGSMMKCCLCCVLFVIFIYTFIFTMLMSNVDTYAHLGGFLTGISIGFVFLPKLKPPRRDLTADQASYLKIWRITGIVVTIVWILLAFILFYTVRHPLPV